MFVKGAVDEQKIAFRKFTNDTNNDTYYYLTIAERIEKGEELSI